MYDPISVSTAVVSSNGDLLIELTDGNVINAGRVVGSPGPRGEKGDEGIRGASGTDGIDGTNGAKWHTGVGAPETSLGVNGDLYMDVAATVLPIYQKVNGDWLFLANLKVAPAGGGGGGTAAGGGGAVIIFPGPQPPTVDNDGNGIDEGDLWVDINDNTLYVYYNGVWSEVTTCSVPGGGGAAGEYLLKYGETVDAPDDVNYSWNQPLHFESEGGTVVSSTDGDVKLEAGTTGSGNELVERTIVDTDPAKQITNKQYVDNNFLRRHGDTINDAPFQVDYVWNQNTAIKSQKIMEVKGQSLYLDGANEIQQMTNEYSVFANRSYFEAYDYVFKKFGRNINWLHLTDDTIETDISVTESSSDKSLTTKKYVDDLWDFSQYPELT